MLDDCGRKCLHTPLQHPRCGTPEGDPYAIERKVFFSGIVGFATAVRTQIGALHGIGTKFAPAHLLLVARDGRVAVIIWKTGTTAQQPAAGGAGSAGHWHEHIVVEAVPLVAARRERSEILEAPFFVE